MKGRIATAVLLSLCLVSGAHAGAPMFKDTTYAALQLRSADDRLIAVVRCESVEILSPGMRRERQVLTTSLLTPAGGRVSGSRLQLGRFAQGAPLMTVGQAYLVVAYRAPADQPWVLIEHRPLDPAQADAAQAAAEADLAQRLR
jgi:hypothetical protein